MHQGVREDVRASAQKDKEEIKEEGAQQVLREEVKNKHRHSVYKMPFSNKSWISLVLL